MICSFHFFNYGDKIKEDQVGLAGNVLSWCGKCI